MKLQATTNNTTKNRNYFSFNADVLCRHMICFTLLYLCFATSDLNSEDMPRHFPEVESLSFPECPKCNNKVPLRVFQKLPLCRTDFHICASLNTSALTSSSQGSIVLFPPHLTFHHFFHIAHLGGGGYINYIGIHRCDKNDQRQHSVPSVPRNWTEAKSFQNYNLELEQKHVE